MTLARPMFPPRVVPPRAAPVPSIETAPPLARRGFLRGFLALAPAVALATAAAAPAAAAPPKRENWKLLRLGEQLAAIEAAFTAAVARKTAARTIVDRDWPAPPAAIVFDRLRDAPNWCGTQCERDIDDKTIFFHGQLRGPRHVADPHQLATYVQLADKRTREARQAGDLLKLAQAFEQSRQAVIDRSGYGEARDDVFRLAHRIGRIAELIGQCECRSMAGLEIKARAIMVAFQTGRHDEYVSFRARLTSVNLASDVIRLQLAA